MANGYHNGNGHKKVYKRGDKKYSTPEKSEEQRKKGDAKNVAGKGRTRGGHTKSIVMANILGKSAIGGPGTPRKGPQPAAQKPAKKYKKEKVIHMSKSAVQTKKKTTVKTSGGKDISSTTTSTKSTPTKKLEYHRRVKVK